MAVTDAWNDLALLERDNLETLDHRLPVTDDFSEFATSNHTSTFDEIATSLADGDLANADLAESPVDDWELQAACRGVAKAQELFFSEELPDIVAAKAICAGCPAIAPCLEGAIGRAEPCGVWGGQLFLNGRVLSQKRRRGRPPKVARPEDQLPEVPVPVHLRELVAAAGS